jgi:hypothetical protein
MGIRAFRYDSRQVDAVPTDIVDNIGNGGNGGNHVQFCVIGNRRSSATANQDQAESD